MHLRRTVVVLAIGTGLVVSAPVADAAARAPKPAHTTSETVLTRSSSCAPEPRNVTCTVTNVTAQRFVFASPVRRAVPVVETYAGVEINKIAYDAEGAPRFLSSTFGSTPTLQNIRVEGVGRTLLGTSTGRDVLEWGTASADGLRLQTFYPDRVEPEGAGITSVEVLLGRTRILGPEDGYPAPVFEQGSRGRILNGASSDGTGSVIVGGVSPGRIEFARTSFTHNTCADFDADGCIEDFEF